MISSDHRRDGTRGGTSVPYGMAIILCQVCILDSAGQLDTIAWEKTQYSLYSLLLRTMQNFVLLAENVRN